MARLKTTIKLLKVSYGIGFQKKDFVGRHTLEYHLQLYLTMMVLQGLLMYLI